MDCTRNVVLFLLVVSLLGLPVSACGQVPTFKEVWHQKKTQRKYHEEQLAAMKAHLDNLRKGVDVLYRGWTTIENIKRGDFNLHRDFFGSFKQVNPHLAKSAKVADIIAFQVMVLRDMRKVRSFCQENDQFTAEEVRYAAALYTNMVFLCDASISELLLVLRSRDAEMNDDERLVRIDRLYEEMQDKRTFARVFAYETVRLSRERSREAEEVERLTTLLE